MQLGAAEAKQLKALEATIAATEAELQPLQKSASGLQAKVAKLQAQIDDAGGEPLRNKKALVASLQEVSHSGTPRILNPNQSSTLG